MSLARDFARLVAARYPEHKVAKLPGTRHWNVRRLRPRSGRGLSLVAKTIVSARGDLEDARRADAAHATETNVLRSLPRWWRLRLVDAFRTGEHRVIVTQELVSCPWSKYAPSPVRNAALARQLAKQVRWLHARRIAHGDLELKNLLWDCEHGTLTVIDFEKARVRAPAAALRRDNETLHAALLELAPSLAAAYENAYRRPASRAAGFGSAARGLSPRQSAKWRRSVGVLPTSGLGVRLASGRGVLPNSGLGVLPTSGLDVRLASGRGVRLASGRGVRLASGRGVRLASASGRGIRLASGLRRFQPPRG